MALATENPDRRLSSTDLRTMGIAPEKARRWFHRPNRALGNVLPLNLLATDAGIEQIETVLGRLEHGLYS